jgi:hypothetical protein
VHEDGLDVEWVAAPYRLHLPVGAGDDIPNFTSFAPEGVGLCAITSNIRDWYQGEFERAMN